MEDSENFEISTVALRGRYSASELRVHMVKAGRIELPTEVSKTPMLPLQHAQMFGRKAQNRTEDKSFGNSCVATTPLSYKKHLCC